MPFWKRKSAPPASQGRLYRCPVCQKESRIPDNEDDPAACEKCFSRARKKNARARVPDSNTHAGLMRQQREERPFRRATAYFAGFVAVCVCLILLAFANANRGGGSSSHAAGDTTSAAGQTQSTVQPDRDPEYTRKGGAKVKGD